MKTNNAVMRRLGSLAIVGVFAALGAGTAGSDDDEGGATGSSTQAATGDGNHGINDAIRLGDTTVTVTEVTTTQRVGGEFYNHTAGANATFVVVRYSETNNGNETLTVLGSPFKLVDGEGRRFEPSSRAEGALATQENLEVLPQLQPGLEHTGAAVFEVPSTAAQGSVQIEFTERGFLGSRTAMISAALPPAQAAAAEAPAEDTN